MSAASSGGVFSSVRCTVSTIEWIGSTSASAISSLDATTTFGMPATRSRPLISIVWVGPSADAVAIVIFTCSAVRSPISMLYLRFT